MCKVCGKNHSMDMKTWNSTYKNNRITIIKKSSLIKARTNQSAGMRRTVPEYDVYINGERRTWGGVYTKALALKLAKGFVSVWGAKTTYPKGYA